MTVKEVTVSFTRQVSQFHPATLSVTAILSEGESPAKTIKTLQLAVIDILYQDDPAAKNVLLEKFSVRQSEVVKKNPENTGKLPEF